MAVPAQPHDAFFRALVDEPARADRLVREYLPPDIAALLADAPVRAVEGVLVRLVVDLPDDHPLEQAFFRYCDDLADRPVGAGRGGAYRQAAAMGGVDVDDCTGMDQDGRGQR